MTEKEFYEEFGNIDPELIEAAAPKTRKRKKILAVRLIAVAACLTVIIISAFMIVPRLVQSNPPDYDVIFFGSGSGTITPYGKEYSEKDVEDLQNYDVIFFGSGSGTVTPYGNDYSEEEVAELQKKYEGVIFSSNGTKLLEVSDKVDDFKEITIQGRTYRAEYSATYRPKIADNEKFGSSKDFHEYMQDTKMRMRVNVATNELILFSDAKKASIKGIISESSAISIADEVFKQVYGEDLRNEYKCIGFVDGSDTPYNVTYVRQVFGMDTNEVIGISLNGNGDVFRIQAQMFRMYDDAEKDITKEEIDAAKKYLTEKLSSKYDIRSTELIINSEGDYYVKAYVWINNSFELAYVNVQ